MGWDGGGREAALPAGSEQRQLPEGPAGAAPAPAALRRWGGSVSAGGHGTLASQRSRVGSAPPPRITCSIVRVPFTKPSTWAAMVVWETCGGGRGGGEGGRGWVGRGGVGRRGAFPLTKLAEVLIKT